MPTDSAPDPTLEHTLRRVGEGLEPLTDPVAATELLHDVVGSIEDGLEYLDDTGPILGPLNPFDPRGNLERIQDGVEWIQDQFSPFAEEIGIPQVPVPPPDDSGGWRVVKWLTFLLAVDWLLERGISFELEVDRALLDTDSSDYKTLGKGGLIPLSEEGVFAAPAAFAARLGDATLHGDAVAPGTGSPTVLIGGRPALRVCDAHVCTKATPAPHTPLGFRSSYAKVLINGFPAVRVGDYVDEGPYGPNPVVAGCFTVIVGPKPPPVSWTTTPADPASDDDTPFPFKWQRIEIGHFKGTVEVGVDLGGPFVRVDGTVTATRLWAEEEWTTEVPLGDPDRDGLPTVWRHTVKTKTRHDIGVSGVTGELRRRGKPSWPKVDPKPNRVERTTEYDDEVVEKEPS